MRLKLLNGAPLCEHLDFSNSTLLDAAECYTYDAKIRDVKSIGENVAFRWRDIGLKRARLQTGWSQPYLPGRGVQAAYDGQSFAIPGIEEFSELSEHDATNLDTTLRLEEDEVMTARDFLQHSLIIHDTLLSSQIVQEAAGVDGSVASSSFLTTSYDTTASELNSPILDTSHALNLQVSSAMTVTPLGSLPSAQHLRFMYPQTPTPNLLCTLMTTPERREVFVRKGGYRMNLWEITIGDDTCSSFKVTFWSRPPRDPNNEDHAQVRLLQTLGHLQVGNIVLLRNIALTSFRETVYGQSLNTAITRARTSVDVLAQSSGVSVAQIGDVPGSVAEALMRVKRWARSHVVGKLDDTRKRKGDLLRPDNTAKRSFKSFAMDEDLPPDTMESL